MEVSYNNDTLSEKMVRVKNTVIQVMHAALPANYLDYVFAGKLSEEDIVNHIMVECCKKAYDDISERHPRKYYDELDGNADDNGRKITEGSHKKINSYREMQYDRLKSQGIIIEGLIPPKMGDARAKMGGYSLTPFQYWEIKNVHDLPLVWHIVDRSITKPNFSTEKIIEDDALYCQMLDEMASSSDPVCLR